MKKKHLLSVCSLFLVMMLLMGMVDGAKPEMAKAASSGEIKQQLDKLEEENDKLEAELKDLRGSLQETENEMARLVAQKDLVDREIVLLTQQAENLNTQISTYALLIADKQDELDRAESRLAEMQERSKLRIRAMEENGKLSYWAVLFNANSFADMLDRMEMVREIAAADEKCLEDLQKAAKEVAAAKEEMTQMLTDLQSRRGELAVLEAELDEKRAETDRLLQDLRARGAEFEEMIEQYELMQEELMEEIANKKDEYEDQKYKEWLSTSKPSGGSGYSPESNATWVQPCKFTYISSPFGMRYHPISGAYKMHNGIDIPGASGTPIYATRSGYVSVAAYQAGGAGNYVSLNHGDGFGSIYMHMTHYIVSVGQYVSAGQVIGYMGTTGGSTGVHLHFGIFYNGTYVNPCNYVNFR